MFVLLVARVAKTTIVNARAEFTIVQSFFRHCFFATLCINYDKFGTLIMNI